jgi:type I restriction-modification system DNA methylase subunit
MPSRWDSLDASKEIEQAISAELRIALEPRGFTVIHNGSETVHAAGGRADIEVRANDKSILILVEVTKRTGAAAEGEFVSTIEHMDALVKKGEYDHYLLLFSAPSIGSRLRKRFLTENREKQARDEAGRSFVLDFAGLQLLLDELTARDSALYPADRWLKLLEEDVWGAASDDTQAREIIARALFTESQELIEELSEETRREHAALEQELKKKLLKLEDKLRDKGITGNEANRTLIFLTFMRLYEEKQKGTVNRMTSAGFTAFVKGLDAKQQKTYQGRAITYLLELIRNEDETLNKAGLLANADGTPVQLHPAVNDALVQELVFPVLDEYEFIGSRVDILGVVFETFAGRAEKDTRVGQFFTPEEVVNFCSDLVELHPKDQVLDPAVGTGRFLIAAMNDMLAHVDEVEGASATSVREHQLHGVDIDVWVATIAKMNMYIHGDGKSNVGNGNGLVVADRGALPQWPDGVAGAIDVVLTNPPLGDVNFSFAATTWLADAGEGAQASDFLSGLGIVPLTNVEKAKLDEKRALIAELEAQRDELEAQDAIDKVALAKVRRRLKTAGDTALALQTKVNAGDVTLKAEGTQMKGGALFIGAIEQYLAASSPNRTAEPIEWRGGRTVLVVDEAILNTPLYARARSFIREHFFVKAVISLGRSAFEYLAHTDAKTSILYLIKKPQKTLAQQEPVFFDHAERVGFDRNGEWIGSDLSEVRDRFDAFRSIVKGGYVGANYNASAVDSQLADLDGAGLFWHARPIGDAGSRLDFFHARRVDLELAMDRSGRKWVTLGDVIRPAERPAPAASRTGEYEFAWVERNTALVRPKGRDKTKYEPRQLWTVQKGQLVVSGIDLVHGALAVAGEDVDGMVMSKEMFAYEMVNPKTTHPAFIALMLRTPQAKALIEGMVTGTSNRTRLSSPDEILSLRIPELPSMADQEALVADLTEAHESYRRTWALLAAASASSDNVWGVEVSASGDA